MNITSMTTQSGWVPEPLPASISSTGVGGVPLIEMHQPDYDSIELADIATQDPDDLIRSLAENAGEITTGVLNSALELANRQADANVDQLRRSFENAVTQAGESYVSLSDIQLNQTMNMMDQINPGWSDALQASSDLTTESANAITMYMAANLPKMMEQGADLAESQGRLAKQLLAGEIPDDVVQQIKTQAAETAQQAGLFGGAAGGAARSLEARDLGLTSLQLQGAGAQMAKDNAALWAEPTLQAAAMASAGQAPVTTLMQQQQSLLPNVDINALFGNAYESLVKEATVSPDSVFQSALGSYNNALGLGLDVYQTNLEAQAQYDSMSTQFEADKMNAQVAAYNAELAANTSLQGASINARSIENAATISANASLMNTQLMIDASKPKESSPLNPGGRPISSTWGQNVRSWGYPGGRPIGSTWGQNVRSWGYPG